MRGQRDLTWLYSAEKGGGGVLWDEGMKEWMKRICFTPSRIALAESARETVSQYAFIRFFYLFLSSLRARDCTTFTLHDLADFYRERDSAPH